MASGPSIASIELREDGPNRFVAYIQGDSVAHIHLYDANYNVTFDSALGFFYIQVWIQFDPRVDRAFTISPDSTTVL